MFGILVPKSRLWAISPTLETGDELDQNFRDMLPRSWYRRRQAKTGRATTYTFANGTTLHLRSGVKPERLKAGRVDMALLNEAQEIDEAAYTKLRPATADRSGLVMMTANPPDRPAGRWVEEYYNRARAGSIAGKAFVFDPRDNPFANYESLAAMSAEVDEKTYQRDVLGLFPPIGDIVFFAWSPRESVRVPPAGFVDVTPTFTKTHLGRAHDHVVGIDLQQTPHMCAAVFRFYADPAEPDQPIAWVIDEVVVEDADENDLIDGLEDRGYDGTCAVVMDASAWWQDGAHTRGKTSDRAFRARGWYALFKPQKDSDRNPDIVERVKATNARLKSAATAIGPSRRRMFSMPQNERINRAMQVWENRGGAPNRRSDYAHLCDAVSYVVYRFFGRPKVKAPKLEYRGIGKLDRKELFKRW
ncbi:MAG: hypothetical protein H0U52_06740 [Chloroflexi bacterium]|nr:hypothetical protein [Chloroflexota bacterium]